VSRIVYDRIFVKTPVGTDVHEDSSVTPRNDGTLRVVDSAGIERRGYARGCWLQWTTQGDAHNRPPGRR